MDAGFMILILMTLIHFSGAVCCGGSQYYCFGRGRCNIFCCNCDGGCQMKRSTTFKVEAARTKFNAIDKNLNNLISVEEAQEFLISMGFNSTEVENEKEWFNSMDLNKNGFIEFQEFDELL